MGKGVACSRLKGKGAAERQGQVGRMGSCQVRQERGTVHSRPGDRCAEEAGRPQTDAIHPDLPLGFLSPISSLVSPHLLAQGSPRPGQIWPYHPITQQSWHAQPTTRRGQDFQRPLGWGGARACVPPTASHPPPARLPRSLGLPRCSPQSNDVISKGSQLLASQLQNKTV